MGERSHLSVYIDIYTYMYLYLLMHIFVCICVYIYVYAGTCYICIYINEWMAVTVDTGPRWCLVHGPGVKAEFINMLSYKFIDIEICLCICICINVYTHTYIHICVYIFIYKYIHS